MKQPLAVTRGPVPPPLPSAQLSGVQSANVYASFDQRAKAFIIDFAVALGGWLLWLLLWLLSGLPPLLSGDVREDFWLVFAMFWFYKTGMECSRWQGTVGKLALGIKVTSLRGERIGFWHASARLLAETLMVATPLGLGYLVQGNTLMVVTPLGLAYLSAGCTRRRQALHDLAARTLVTRREFTPEEIAEARLATSADGGKETGILVLGGLVFIFLAAVATRAYKASNLGVQVDEGVSTAAPYESAVAAAISSGRPAASIDDTDLAISATDHGEYVESITVTKGVVGITYGRHAHAELQGRHLLLYPMQKTPGVISWVCGNAATSAGVVLDAHIATDIPQEYLPPPCR